MPAIWAFCSVAEFRRASSRARPEAERHQCNLVKVPFDLAHWQKVAAEKYPDGLPEPESDDPTQWLFHGRPEESTAPLQVAVARLLGYRWPAELDDKMRLSKRARALVKRCEELAKFADDDGIVCIPSVRGEEPAAERLLALLLRRVRQCELAGGRPGRLAPQRLLRGALQAVPRPAVRLAHLGRPQARRLPRPGQLPQALRRRRQGPASCWRSLTYAYLGDWITRQKDGVKRGEGGAEDRLAAALELQKRLEAILEGEPPFDIFVRWKPLAEQPIGWEPDINDGVRMNIRPFLASRPARRPDRRRRPALEAQHQVGQGPRQGAGAPEGRVPVVLGLGREDRGLRGRQGASTATAGTTATTRTRPSKRPATRRRREAMMSANVRHERLGKGPGWSGEARANGIDGCSR